MPQPPVARSGQQEDWSKEVVGDISNLAWVNKLLEILWPKANTALIQYVHDELTPRLQEALPAPFKGVHFARFTLGSGVPELGPIEVMRHSERHIQVELDLRYVSNVDILLDSGTAGIAFGIRELAFAGRLCLALFPILGKWPVIGGAQLFFANQPRVELKFAGLADGVARFPGLARRVQEQVDDLFRSAMVLPNFKSCQFTHDERIMDMTDARSQQPLGVLRVKVLCARNLAGANWQMGLVERFTSDPYCVLRLGASTSRTSAVRGSTSPAWPESEPSAHFLVYHHEQELEIDVCSEDLLRRNFVSFLGLMPATSVRTLLQHAEPVMSKHGVVQYKRRVLLDTSKVNGGMLHVNDPVNTGVASELDLLLGWLDLRAAPAPSERGTEQPSAAAEGETDPAALLLVELHGGTGFPEEAVVNAKNGLRWQCRLEQQAQQRPLRSKRGSYHSDAPDYGAHFHEVLLPVVDRLIEYGMPLQDIALIIEEEPAVVADYLDRKQAYVQRMKERKQQTGEERCVELRWHETMPLLVRRPAEACLLAELLDGGDEVIGHLETIPLQHVLEQDGSMARASFSLRSPQESSRGAGVSSWFLPYCNKPVLARNRFHAVRMELSLRLQYLVPGRVPRTLGATASDISDSTPGCPNHGPARPRGPVAWTWEAPVDKVDLGAAITVPTATTAFSKAMARGHGLTETPLWLEEPTDLHAQAAEEALLVEARVPVLPHPDEESPLATEHSLPTDPVAVVPALASAETAIAELGITASSGTDALPPSAVDLGSTGKYGD